MSANTGNEPWGAVVLGALVAASVVAIVLIASPDVQRRYVDIQRIEAAINPMVGDDRALPASDFTIEHELIMEQVVRLCDVAVRDRNALAGDICMVREEMRAEARLDAAGAATAPRALPTPMAVKARRGQATAVRQSEPAPNLCRLSHVDCGSKSPFTPQPAAGSWLR